MAHSASTALLVIGLFLAFMTFLKTGAYFLSSATIIPIRTGIVRDIRNQLYQKITSLSLGFFSEERKGDIIARMSGDVQEVENSIMSSLDMLFKNPILILFYFITLICISWQLTLFTIIFVPPFGWFMGFVGKKLKAKSTEAQALWSDTMSMVEETLGGLRIIKAFCAEDKMNWRFNQVNSSYRDNIMRVNIRQQMAHPMSEFLGTILIVVVLWFGGILVLDYGRIDGPTIIFYLVMLYSIINPLKEFSKASYNIPKGLASMERIDKILQAEVEIKDKENPDHIASFEHQIEFRHVSFAYTDHQNDELVYVLKDINLVICRPQGACQARQAHPGGQGPHGCFKAPPQQRRQAGLVQRARGRDRLYRRHRRKRPDGARLRPDRPRTCERGHGHAVRSGYHEYADPQAFHPRHEPHPGGSS